MKKLTHEELDDERAFRCFVHDAIFEFFELGVRIMASIDDLVNDVAAESTVDDSIIALVQGLQTQLAAALANVTIPPDVQAKIDQAFAGIEANKAKLAAAVVAGTPAAPAAPAAPTT